MSDRTIPIDITTQQQAQEQYQQHRLQASQQKNLPTANHHPSTIASSPPTTTAGIAAHRHSSMASVMRSGSGPDSRPSASGMSVSSGYRFGHRDSLSGAQPIWMSGSASKPRRESLAGSMVTGMSWGRSSVGSWIRDDIIMQGSSPFPYQSPSFHSSSYQPKLEADFMRDFSCCGLTLATLHDLLEHYEENHHQHMEELQKRASNEPPPPDPKAAIATNTAAALKDPQSQSQSQQQHNSQKHSSPSSQSRSSPDTPQQSNAPTQHQKTPQGTQHGNHASSALSRAGTAAGMADQDDDRQEETVGNMEMDDEDYGPASGVQQAYQTYPHSRMMTGSPFGQSTNRTPPLDLSAATGASAILQHQGLRQSTPTTPISANGRPFYHQHNPTVSSVNTPTLTAYPPSHPLQHQPYYTPDSSAPGTPRELDSDFVGNLSQMNVSGGNSGLGNMNFMPNNGYSSWTFQPSNDMLDLCIDEPAKRLYASNNNGANPGTDSGNPLQNAATFNPTLSQQTTAAHSGLGTNPSTCASAVQLGDGQYGENSELARTIREQQKLAGVPDPSADGVNKPFHCPVIGCEKAYKNQNGLKYHKSHGHNTQTLHANTNGTFSIVDPNTRKPFPGTLGMEKHKPYQCQTCGKRYKNLNGLKYHKAHSPGCDPEIRGLPPGVSGLGGGSGSANASKRNSLDLNRVRRLGEEAATTANPASGNSGMYSPLLVPPTRGPGAGPADDGDVGLSSEEMVMG